MQARFICPKQTKSKNAFSHSNANGCKVSTTSTLFRLITGHAFTGEYTGWQSVIVNRSHCTVHGRWLSVVRNLLLARIDPTIFDNVNRKNDLHFFRPNSSMEKFNSIVLPSLLQLYHTVPGNKCESLVAVSSLLLLTSYSLFLRNKEAGAVPLSGVRNNSNVFYRLGP